jgi:hypothetical protein
VREKSEDVGSNPSANLSLEDVLAVRLSRREAVSGALAVAVASTLADRVAFAGEHSRVTALDLPQGTFNFPELGVRRDERDHVADGYQAEVLIRWGDPVLPGAPAFNPERPSDKSQARQWGYNNDFIGFLPIEGRSDHGLLVVNHEYVNEELMFPGSSWVNIGRLVFGLSTKARVDVEMMAHGGSIIEIKREDGRWGVVPGSKFARRITARTPMRISGPAAGHALLKTSADPSGTQVEGMLNNCAGGITPWGTWLTCEENINFYFMDTARGSGGADAAALKRYGIPSSQSVWGKFYDRFDISKEPNESNRFGWVVEIDPFDPDFVPVKRTALGRFKHEGAGNVINKDGRFVVYQGDDERFDYVYRFVTEGVVDRNDAKANADLLDKGTLSVARFDADGTGEWLPLVHGHGPLVAENGFADQGDVLIHARLAADRLGATKMDRPEDIEVSPLTGKVYVMLTLNEKRTASGERGIDPANPRANNAYGHVVEIIPDDGNHAASRFRWEILLKCGDPKVAAVGATFNPATSESGWFANPDNCVFDAEGRLWIATDGISTKPELGRSDGLWALDVEGERRGMARCFYQAPAGAELCGPCFTPDLETLFVAVQHPGETPVESLDALPSTFDNPSTRWPDFKDGVPPRPSVVVITKKGGGKIGV